LVEACRQIPDIKLRMVGAVSQEMKHKLVSLAGNDSDWLEIQGQLSHNETVSEMKSCDVFVLPTYTEGFPNVIIESMACACPIVACAVGAIPEILVEDDGKSYGQLIQPKDPEQIRVAIERYLSDQEYKRECGENARRRVRERYNVESIGVQLTKIWERVIAEK
jgi:glycosyltransferase involved in cell wall biosynthesis